VSQTIAMRHKGETYYHHAKFEDDEHTFSFTMKRSEWKNIGEPEKLVVVMTHAVQ